MSEFWSEEIITAYLDDRLSAKQRAQVESHLKSHPQDAETLRDFQQIRSEFRCAQQFQLDDEFANRVVAAIKTAPNAGEIKPKPDQNQTPLGLSVINHRSSWRSAAAAMTALAATLLLVFIVSPPQTDLMTHVDDVADVKSASEEPNNEDLTRSVEDRLIPKASDNLDSLALGRPTEESSNSGGRIDQDNSFATQFNLSNPDPTSTSKQDLAESSKKWEATVPARGRGLGTRPSDVASSSATNSDTRQTNSYKLVPGADQKMTLEVQQPSQPTLARSGGGQVAPADMVRQIPKPVGESQSAANSFRVPQQKSTPRPSADVNMVAEIMVVQTAETQLNQAVLRQLLTGKNNKLAVRDLVEGKPNPVDRRMDAFQFRKNNADQFGNRFRQAPKSNRKATEKGQERIAEASTVEDDSLKKEQIEQPGKSFATEFKTGLLAQQHSEFTLVEIEATESQMQNVLARLGGEYQVLRDLNNPAGAITSASTPEDVRLQQFFESSTVAGAELKTTEKGGDGFGGGAGKAQTQADKLNKPTTTDLDSIKIVRRMSAGRKDTIEPNQPTQLNAISGSSVQAQKQKAGAPSSRGVFPPVETGKPPGVVAQNLRDEIDSNDATSKDTASKDTASKDTASKDTASKDTASKDTASKDNEQKIAGARGSETVPAVLESLDQDKSDSKDMRADNSRLRRSRDRSNSQAPKQADQDELSSNIAQSEKDATKDASGRYQDLQLLKRSEETAKTGDARASKSNAAPGGGRQLLQDRERTIGQAGQQPEPVARSQPAPATIQIAKDAGMEGVTADSIAQKQAQNAIDQPIEVRNRYWLWIRVVPGDQVGAADSVASGFENQAAEAASKVEKSADEEQDAENESASGEKDKQSDKGDKSSPKDN